MEGESVSVSQVIKSELAIFDEMPIQTTHLKGQWVAIEPSNNYAGTDGTSIIISIPKAEGWYLDFNDAHILLDVAIVNDDKTKITDAVAFCNFLSAALFKDVKLVGGGKKSKVKTKHAHTKHTCTHCSALA